MRSSLLARTLPVLLLTGALAACSDNESPSGTEDHTPATYTVLVNGSEMQPPIGLVEGQAVSVQLKFFNAEDEDLDIIEDTHFGGLTFSPADLATVARDQLVCGSMSGRKFFLRILEYIHQFLNRSFKAKLYT